MAGLEQLGKELGELQELLAAAQYHSLLIVLQGMDTSGKRERGLEQNDSTTAT